VNLIRSHNCLVVHFASDDEVQAPESILDKLIRGEMSLSTEVASSADPEDSEGRRRPSPGSPDFLADVARSAKIAVEMAASTLEEVRALSKNVHELTRAAVTLLSRLTDITHFTVPEAARFLDVSEATVRSRIKRGMLRLESIPGTRRSGIPLGQLSSGWMPTVIARELAEKERP
jgi:DNA-directed RNA polymerase specialized sigma24 family protein